MRRLVLALFLGGLALALGVMIVALAVTPHWSLRTYRRLDSSC
jgi:hypothetical protein